MALTRERTRANAHYQFNLYATYAGVVTSKRKANGRIKLVAIIRQVNRLTRYRNTSIKRVGAAVLYGVRKNRGTNQKQQKEYVYFERMMRKHDLIDYKFYITTLLPLGNGNKENVFARWNVELK